jgi:digeranylgeranylglycerophospholipid reductase
MKVEETEILVIGGGPAGLIAAREAAQKDVEVKVLEEDPEIGCPCHCAGLLSYKGLESLGVNNYEAFAQNNIKGARFFSPSRLSFTVKRSEPIACVVDRSMFDKFLAKQILPLSQIKLNSKVHDIKRDKTGITAICEKEVVRAKVIIDAEGVSSSIVKAARLKPINFEYVLTGLQCDLKDINVNPDYVEVHTGRKIAPNFFIWVIPLGEDSVRVGLGCKGKRPKELLKKFVKDRFGEKIKFERVTTRSGLIFTGGPIEKTYDDRLMIIGDAAGQVKPITGGGVVVGGNCASIAGNVVAEAVKQKDFSGSFLRKYELLWKKKYIKEFKTTLLARKIMNRLTDQTIDMLFKVIIEENLQESLSIYGDIDFQRSSILKLLKVKKILRVLPFFLKNILPLT